MPEQSQIAKRSGSNPIYTFMIALSAFNLGRYSEHFSGSVWAWFALVGNLLLLCWLLFSMIAGYRKTRTL
jgi:uncharacterized membrane protein